MKNKFIIHLFLITTLLGCTTADFKKDPEELALCTTADFEQDPILKNDPEELALVHYKSNSQTKWMGCYGFTAYVPGAPENIIWSAEDTNVHWITGTSDALSGNAHEKYNDKAIRFAEIYNKKRAELAKTK